MGVGMIMEFLFLILCILVFVICRVLVGMIRLVVLSVIFGFDFWIMDIWVVGLCVLGGSGFCCVFEICELDFDEDIRCE